MNVYTGQEHRPAPVPGRNRHRVIASFLALGTSLFAAAAGIAGAQPLFDGKSEESLRIRKDEKTGHVVTEQQKVNYHAMTLYGEGPGGTDRSVVIRETLRTSMDEGLEGVRSHLKVDLFFANADRKYEKTPSHTLEVPEAGEAKFEDRFWTALTFGCCDMETYGRLYTYGGSKPFLRYNEQYWRVEVPNSRNLRFTGVVLRPFVPNDAAASAIFGNETDAVACLSWAAPGKPLDSVLLRPKKGVKWEGKGIHTGILEVSSPAAKDEVRQEERLLTLWSLDGAEEANKGRRDVTGVTITAGLHVDDGENLTTETLTVTVENDRLTGARVTGGLLEVVQPSE